MKSNYEIIYQGHIMCQALFSGCESKVEKQVYLPLGDSIPIAW